MAVEQFTEIVEHRERCAYYNNHGAPFGPRDSFMENHLLSALLHPDALSALVIAGLLEDEQALLYHRAHRFSLMTIRNAHAGWLQKCGCFRLSKGVR